MRILVMLAATGAGAAVGWVCGLLPGWPVAWLAAAAVLGALVGSVSVGVFTLFTLSRSGSGGIGAVSIGLVEAVLELAVAVLVAVVSYFVLRRLGWIPASVATYGPTIFGGGAALIAAAWWAI